MDAIAPAPGPAEPTRDTLEGEAAAPLGTATPTRDIAVVGTSAGGVRALQELVSQLPSDHAGALFVVMHTSREMRSLLAAILARAGPLPAVPAEDGMAVEPGRIHVAPANHHLLLEPGRMRVVQGPEENRHRPAIDPLFRSAAWAYGPRVVGVVLTGTLDDGTAGLWAVKSCGGVTVVQDPAEAEHPDMPMNALTHNRIDHRLPIAEIAALLARLAREPLPASPPRGDSPAGIGDEVEFAKLGSDMAAMARLGTLSPFTCPACRGALWELQDGGHLRYRCHTGHAYSQSSLLIEQTESIEQNLYAAMRAVEEKAAALRRLATRWPEHLPSVKDDYEQRARALDAAAETLKRILGGGSL